MGRGKGTRKQPYTFKLVRELTKAGRSMGIHHYDEDFAKRYIHKRAAEEMVLPKKERKGWLRVTEYTEWGFRIFLHMVEKHWNPPRPSIKLGKPKLDGAVTKHRHPMREKYNYDSGPFRLAYHKHPKKWVESGFYIFLKPESNAAHRPNPNALVGALDQILRNYFADWFTRVTLLDTESDICYYLRVQHRSQVPMEEVVRALERHAPLAKVVDGGPEKQEEKELHCPSP